MKKLAALLGEVGAANSKGGQDTIAAHISPREARLLKLLGGSGRRDPVTGMLHFDDDGNDGGYGGADDGPGGGPGEGGSWGPGGDANNTNNESNTPSGDNAPSAPDGGAYSFASLAESVARGDQGSITGDDLDSDPNNTVESTYNEVTGDLGTSGRGGNTGGIESSPTGNLAGYEGGNMGQGLGMSVSDAAQNYEDQGAFGWNAENNYGGGLSGYAQSGLHEAQDYLSSHPGWATAIGIGAPLAATFLGAPAWGVGLANMAYNAMQGKGVNSSQIGQTVGGLAGPYGGMIGGLAGGMYDNKGAPAFTGVVNTAVNSLTQGGLGQLGQEVAGKAGGLIGGALQGLGINAGLNTVQQAINEADARAAQSGELSVTPEALASYNPSESGDSTAAPIGLASTSAPLSITPDAPAYTSTGFDSGNTGAMTGNDWSGSITGGGWGGGGMDGGYNSAGTQRLRQLLAQQGQSSQNTYAPSSWDSIYKLQQLREMLRAR